MEEGGIKEGGGVTPNVVGERRKWMKMEEGRDMLAACSTHCLHCLSFPFLLQSPPCPLG